MFVTLFHILRRSRRARWGWVLPAGFFFASIGYGLRLPRSFSALSSVTLYAVQYMCVVLSPCAFLAFNYIVFGRFIVALDPDLKEEGKQRKRQKSRLTFIPPRLVGRGFIISDVCTFLIQATGGGLQSAGGSQRPVGDKIFVVGLVLQAGK
jgi:RTA1 like protein